MNSVVKNVKMYACRNATNNSKQLKAVQPSTTTTLIGPHNTQPAAAAKGTMLTNAASTKWPASMFANNRTHKLNGLMNDPSTSSTSRNPNMIKFMNLPPMSG